MQETNDIKIIPVGQLEEQRQEEVLMMLEEIKYEIKELKTLQVGD